MDRLSYFVQPGNRVDANEFYAHCLSLSRGIDYALANGDIPRRARELPGLMKQVFLLKNDEITQAAIMVMMVSVKNACEFGWFQPKESEELVTIAEEIAKVYRSLGSITTRPSSCNSAISSIMEKFYPNMKLGPIVVSIEAKPGYGASIVDFHITKNKHLKDDKLYLLVVQTDNIETSACLISPQQVSFLLNGSKVKYRTNVDMEAGPQMPTNVNGMLKYGTNLLQAVGQFNGHYVILITHMSVISMPEHPVLQDYFQPAVTSVDSDIIEGPSQISLNCPISFTRIKVPVKGHSCKHFQCFDFHNFINMNSSRPSWRCPHCNQSVCYTDIRLDRNMVEILKDVGENIAEVIVLANGSWKAVLEKDHDKGKMQTQAQNGEKEQRELQESTCSPSTVPNVCDLTKDDHLETMSSCEIADRKPFQAPVLSMFANQISTSSGMNSAGVNRNVIDQLDDDFWSGVYAACGGMSDTPTNGVSENPVLPDSVPLAFNQESGSRDNNPAINSAMHNQFSATNNLQMQMNYVNSLNEYGRSSSGPRHISRSPVAVQALPVQSPALGPQQNSVTNLNNSLLPSSSSATPHIPMSNPVSVDALNVILSDTERQQHFSRTPVNMPQVSGVNSPAFPQHPATQNRVTPVNTSAPTQLHNLYRPSSMLGDFRNPHLQQALNTRPPQPTRTSTPPMRSLNTQRSHIQPGGSQSQPGIFQTVRAAANSQQVRATANAQAARIMMPAQPAVRQGSSQVRNVQPAGATTHSHQARVMVAPQGLTGEQRANPVQSVSRTDELFSAPSEQNWLPTARMRGSLDLSQRYDDSIAQRIITPTQSGQSSRPPGPQPVRSTGVTPQLDVLIPNSRNAQNYSSSK
ncbi:hypothetical protein RJT34_05327 [Clitoria ternatea]|uniref:SP-RING-type domain-containing protein n=1 Tax=Clitoria ternatea TaxID=43366 RepID=A0AAN9PSJ0_CLITE